ncbi:MAG: hypoxanthine phosphoribosyltransferase [Bacillota bacterium]
MRILIEEKRIRERVKELAAQISGDYDGHEVLLVGVLKGAVMFMADLARQLKCPCSMDFMAVSSYGMSTHSSGVVRILKDLDNTIEGKHVLLVEDIVDTGLTLNYICSVLRARKPTSLKVCVLLDKPSRRKVDVHLDYVGFQIPDEFVVGYGLDYQEKFRQMPYVAVLEGGDVH